MRGIRWALGAAALVGLVIVVPIWSPSVGDSVTSVDFAASPRITVAPSVSLTDNEPITVFANDLPGGRHTMSQCPTDVIPDIPTDVGVVARWCVPLVPAPSVASFEATAHVVEVIEPPSGTSTDCTTDSCSLVVATPVDGDLYDVVSAPLRFRGLFEISVTDDLTDGATVEVSIGGLPAPSGATAVVAQCLDEGMGFDCGNATAFDATTSFSGSIEVVRILETPSGTHDCTVEVCAVGVGVISAEGDLIEGTGAAITFAPE